MASYFKNNPYVWFGTDNEPTTAGGSLSDWQLATYNAIRNAGNNNPILLEPSGSRPPGYGGTPLQAAMNPADYARMTNVIWDPHCYGYQSSYDTNQADVNANVQAMITASQSIRGADESHSRHHRRIRSRHRSKRHSGGHRGHQQRGRFRGLGLG